jgi:hypothetical protein
MTVYLIEMLLKIIFKDGLYAKVLLELVTNNLLSTPFLYEIGGILKKSFFAQVLMSPLYRGPV